jgi:hypothetical protein
MVIGHEDGHEEAVDQLLDGLPFNASGTFEHPPEGRTEAPRHGHEPDA